MGTSFNSLAAIRVPRALAVGLGLVTFIALAGCATSAPDPAPAKTPAAIPATTSAVALTATPELSPTANTAANPAAQTVVESQAASDQTESIQDAAPPANPMMPAAEGKIEPILATTVINPGVQRVSFLLVGEKSIIKAPEATVSATYLGDGQSGDGASTGPVQATYHGWPFGIRGAYSTEMAFDRPGPWQLNVSVQDEEVAGSTVIDLEVVEDSPIPGIGDRPPLSQTKTLDEVGAVEKLTTDYNADAELYLISVADAVESPRPAVIVFASPAFCTSATCGPQVDTVKELKAAYQGQADFVHVEIYDLPDEIQGDLSRAQFAEAVEEWGFPSLPHWFNESWVFIINEQGTIGQRFEGYATLTELEAALKKTLQEG